MGADNDRVAAAAAAPAAAIFLFFPLLSSHSLPVLLLLPLLPLLPLLLPPQLYSPSLFHPPPPNPG